MLRLTSMLPETFKSPPTSAQPNATRCSPVNVPEPVKSTAVTELDVVMDPLLTISLAVRVDSVAMSPMASIVLATLRVSEERVASITASLAFIEVAVVISDVVTRVVEVISVLTSRE